MKDTKYSGEEKNKPKTKKLEAVYALMLLSGILDSPLTYPLFISPLFFLDQFQVDAALFLANCYLSAQLVARFSRYSLFCFITSQRRIDSRLALLLIYQSEDGGYMVCD